MISQKKHPPLIYNHSIADKKLCDFISIIADIQEFSTDISKENELILKSIFSNSPYLSSLIFKYPDFTLSLFDTKIDILLNQILTEIHQEVPKITSINILTKNLRIYKAKIALLLSYADLTEKFDLFQVTDALSNFAEISVSLTIAHLLKAAMVKGDLAVPEYLSLEDITKLGATLDFTRKSGYTVLAMGKLGGRELNYSSDIDLIILYDHEIIQYRGRKTAKDFFVKLTQQFVKIMQDRTADGYVFRTDLRLRPDPSATPIALSMEAAEIYYQTSGLTWERAAMIKARPIAGDIEAGYSFLSRINGFIWRRHLDYAALEDIHSIKKLIHNYHKHGEITLSGQDVKLGPGGIREIEFYAQIFQLISGGKEPALRVAPTCRALDILEQTGKITPEDHKNLTESYIYYRTLEHRLQMINDDQTHVIPDSKEDIERISKFMGYQTVQKFEDVFLNHLNRTHHLFNDLLYDSNQSAINTNEILPFLPDEFHPTTLKYIKECGFDNPKEIYKIIQNWLSGRYRACRTERARNKLLKLVPSILKSFADYRTAKEGFLRFDHFLSQLPSGVQLFSFLTAQPWLLDLLAKIMNMAPNLSNSLAKRPLLLDAMLSENFFMKSHEFQSLESQLRKDLDEQMMLSRDYEDSLNITRKWVNEHKFQVGVQILKNDISPPQAGQNFSLIADISLQKLLNETQKNFSLKHGIIKKGEFAIIALGKLGGRELTSISDLDLIFIYDYYDDKMTQTSGTNHIMSNGKKPLEIHQYYNKLGQRFINSITALTGEGKLYEIDMRLRPSGSKGALALPFAAFETYQLEQAWTWEHMALSRARVIIGPNKFRSKLNQLIARTNNHSGRRPDKLLYDVAQMRQKLRTEFGTSNIWSMKHTKGGLVDIEFICQYLALKYGMTDPELLEPNTLKLIKKLTHLKLLQTNDGNGLYEACKTFQTCQLLLRLCMGTASKNTDRPEELLSSLAARLGCQNAEQIEAYVIKTLKFVTEIYQKIIEIPAQNLSNDIENGIFIKDKKC
jgi:glutamate-ammonia-ligase adenylyltransferase